MKLQNQFNKIFFLLLFVSLQAWGETKWEMATLFLGGKEDDLFQADVDANIMEMARLTPSKKLKLSIYRESPRNTYSYFPNVKSIKEANLGDLVMMDGLGSYTIPGKFSVTSRKKLPNYLKSAFKDPKSKKLLILYGHGLGPTGLKDLNIEQIKKLLSQLNIKFDVIWFDSCFLGNLEFLYEIRKFSHFTVSSQEAEFTSGLPFDSLEELPSLNTAKEAAILLAKRFIESYSFIKGGRQTRYVSSSSATITVMDNSKLDQFIENLDVINDIKNLSEQQQALLRTKLEKLYAMDNNNLVDLGQLLLELQKVAPDERLTQLLSLLNINSVKNLRTNPRVKIYWPLPDAVLVFGFNQWQMGHQDDYSINPIFSEIINSEIFILGPNNKNWPTKTTKLSSIKLTPFAPGLNNFNYYFVDSKTNKTISAVTNAQRTHDFVETTGEFLVYQAYTQKVGSKAEKYTGLSITNFGSIPSMDYYELEFNQKFDWLKL